MLHRLDLARPIPLRVEMGSRCAKPQQGSFIGSGQNPEMNSSFENSPGPDPAQLREMMSLFAAVNHKLTDIAIEFRKKPIVAQVRTGCDLRKYRDCFRFGGDVFYSFEAHLEVDTSDGSQFCWLTEINCIPSGWELRRTNTSDTAAGRESETLPELSSNSFAEFAPQAFKALSEFNDSARAHSLGSR